MTEFSTSYHIYITSHKHYACMFIMRNKIDMNKIGGINMKQSTYQSYDDLPLFLNVNLVAQVLGVSLLRGAG